ncbi:MAG: hypothetical protein ABSC37_16270 [Xanthobacteraceae bacterium]|jgi:hypothetical protein
MRFSNIKSIRACAGLAAVLALMAFAMPARAADPVFPTGSRVGLVPPAGMIPTTIFPGFEDAAKNAAIIITTLPATAYAQMEKTVVTDALKKEGISVEKREPIQLNIGKGFLIVGTQAADKSRYRKWLLVAAADDLTVFVNVQAPEQDGTYTDTVVRAALATLSLRATVPDEERLSLLPFTVGDLAGFHIEGVLPGRGLMLVDPVEGGLDARLWVTALEGGPAEADDRANFARVAFDGIAGIKDVQITMSEPLRIGGQAGFQTMAQAKGSITGIDMMVVQWLRFGSGGFLQMIGMGRADNWTAILARLRAVRDSIEPK